MAKLEPWDGRKLCTVELADSYYASECAVPIMGGHAVFQKGVTDKTHPYARSKELALTYAEASSLADGRFSVTPAAQPAAEESKTDRARKRAAAVAENESEG